MTSFFQLGSTASERRERMREGEDAGESADEARDMEEGDPPLEEDVSDVRDDVMAEVSEEKEEMRTARRCMTVEFPLWLPTEELLFPAFPFSSA